MADYIKRADAMTICERYSSHCFESSDARGQDIADRILDDIAEMSTADVEEVVRCKDCIKRDTDDCWIAFYGEDGELFCDTLDNDYCGRGESK